MDTKPKGLDGELARVVIKKMAAWNVRVYMLTREIPVVVLEPRSEMN
jgi:hypothetical protein